VKYFVAILILLVGCSTVPVAKVVTPPMPPRAQSQAMQQSIIVNPSPLYTTNEIAWSGDTNRGMIDTLQMTADFKNWTNVYSTAVTVSNVDVFITNAYVPQIFYRVMRSLTNQTY
jgi:hypothetical protein